MSVNKHEAMKTWVESFLGGSKMHFDDINAYQGARSLVPNYGDFKTGSDILGNIKKLYSFGFVAIEPVDFEDTGTNNTSTRNMIDSFNDWLVEQEQDKNYPDFGEKVTKYKIVPLQDTANLAQRFVDNGMGKYILAAQIEYVEKE